MAITSDTQDITTTASELGTGRGGRRVLVVRNPLGSGATIYLGSGTVTVADAAFMLDAGDPSLVLASGENDSLGSEEWYAITASGTASAVAVTEV